jgi:hypothetical protein
MRNRNGFRQIVPRRFVRANRIAAVHPPRAPRLSASKRRWSGSTLMRFVLLPIAITVVLLALALPVSAAAREVGAMTRTVPARLVSVITQATTVFPVRVWPTGRTPAHRKPAIRHSSSILKRGQSGIALTQELRFGCDPIAPRGSSCLQLLAMRLSLSTRWRIETTSIFGPRS